MRFQLSCVVQYLAQEPGYRVGYSAAGLVSIREGFPRRKYKDGDEPNTPLFRSSHGVYSTTVSGAVYRIIYDSLRYILDSHNVFSVEYLNRQGTVTNDNNVHTHPAQHAVQPLDDKSMERNMLWFGFWETSKPHHNDNSVSRRTIPVSVFHAEYTVQYYRTKYHGGCHLPCCCKGQPRYYSDWTLQ